MKHILNNLSEEEKNSILEQHTGGMKIMNENFSKLLNSKLGDVKPLVSEQVLPGLSSGNSHQSVKQVFDSCRNVPAQPNNTTNQLVDMVYKAVQGLGTDESAIINAFSRMGTITNFCAVNNVYRKTYGTDLYADLDGDIDQETVWAGISRGLRSLNQSQSTKPTVKPTGGAPVKTTGGTVNQTVMKQKRDAIMKQRQAAGGQTQPVQKTATQTAPTQSAQRTQQRDIRQQNLQQQRGTVR